MIANRTSDWGLRACASLDIRRKRRLRTRQECTTNSLDALVVVTANTGTLRPGQIRCKRNLATDGLTPRAVEIDGVMSEAAVHVIGLQEARIPGSGWIRGPTFDMYRSSSDSRGCDGSQLWINRSLKARVKATRANHPRLVTTVASISDITFGFVVAHAPIEAADYEDKRTFYEYLELELEAARKASSVTILLIDANGTVGTSTSLSTGDIGAEKETANGNLLRTHCDAWGLCLANTWFGRHTTWENTTGHRRRIDYVAVDSRFKSALKDSWILDADIAPGGRPDHSAVAVSLDMKILAGLIAEDRDLAKQPKPCLNIDADSLHDRGRIVAFQRSMRHHVVDEHGDLDQEVEKWTTAVQAAAGELFARQSRPKCKPWIDTETWQLMCEVKALRQRLRSWTLTLRASLLRQCLLVWRGHLSTWRAYCEARWRLNMERKLESICDIEVARAHVNIRRTVRFKNRAVVAARRSAFEKLAARADYAAKFGNMSQLYKMAVTVGGRQPRPHAGIEDENGVLLTDTAAVEQRWVRHYCDVLAATPHLDSEVACPVGRPTTEKRLTTSWSEVHNDIQDMNGRKATGLDRISASLLQAGGWIISSQIHSLLSMCYSSCTVPSLWRGGRMTNVPKKGSPHSCDNWRGILVNSHVAKLVATKIYRVVQDEYASFVGCSQFGATARMGTALAGHTLRQTMEIAKQRNWSVLLVFCDLSKAFDKLVRETVFGWSDDVEPEHRFQRLLDLGLDEHTAVKLQEYIDKNGTAMSQAGASPEAVDLMRSLHSAAWFQVGAESATPVVTKRGGRQGCKLGPLVFNMGYELPLDIIRRKLSEAGYGVHISGGESCPWAPSAAAVLHFSSAPDRWSGRPLIDVVYVDDVGFIVMCATPYQMHKATPTILATIADTFDMFGMELNYKKGKTEAFLVYRGRRQAHYKELLENDDFKLAVPGHPGKAVSVVTEYIHLGTCMDCDCNPNADVNRRVSSAMCSYVPIASVLARTATPVKTRLSLASSLVFTRLLFNVHTWNCITDWAWTKLCGVYHRVLRRISGAVRSASNHFTDADVRYKLNVPSLQHIVRRNRLIYLASLLRSPATHLKALVTVTQPDGGYQPWTQLVRSDLLSLWTHFQYKLQDLGHPLVFPHKWQNFMMEYPSAWKDIVNSWQDTSLLEHQLGSGRKRRRKEKEGGDIAYKYVCPSCPAAFYSAQGLSMHRRMAHNFQTQPKFYADADGICPACRKKFPTRLRLIAHLTDGRVRYGRIPCRSKLQRLTPLSSTRVAELDLLDAACRAQARKAGRSQPVVGGRKRKLLPVETPPSFKRYRIRTKSTCTWLVTSSV